MIIHKPLYTLNLTQTGKNLKYWPLIPNVPKVQFLSYKEWLSAASVLGLGILDSALYLTQYSILKELA